MDLSVDHIKSSLQLMHVIPSVAYIIYGTRTYSAHSVMYETNLPEHPTKMTWDINILVPILIETRSLPNDLSIFTEVLKASAAE